MASKDVYIFLLNKLRCSKNAQDCVQLPSRLDHMTSGGQDLCQHKQHQGHIRVLCAGSDHYVDVCKEYLYTG